MNKSRINWFFIVEYMIGLYVTFLFINLVSYLDRTATMDPPYSHLRLSTEAFLRTNYGFLVSVFIILLLPIIIDFVISLLLKRKHFWIGSLSILLGEITFFILAYCLAFRGYLLFWR